MCTCGVRAREHTCARVLVLVQRSHRGGPEKCVCLLGFASTISLAKHRRFCLGPERQKAGTPAGGSSESEGSEQEGMRPRGVKGMEHAAGDHVEVHDLSSCLSLLFYS